MKRLKNVCCFYAMTIAVIIYCISGASYAEQSRGFKVVFKNKAGDDVGFYSGNHALLVGVSDYTDGWPDLESIPGELEKIKNLLSKRGFSVQTVLNPNSRELSRAFMDFIDEYGYNKDDRLLFFFSGHGYTRKSGKKGYLVPTDAPDPRKDEKKFLRKAVDMGQVLSWARQMESKHALFLFDSCFSGTIFKTRALPKHPPHINDFTSRPVRQFITAGSAGEEVPARSIFVPSFIKALNGEADINRDGYITGTELGMFLHDKVLNYSKIQTPQYGKIRDPDLDEGDFVFQLPKTAKTKIKTVQTETPSPTSSIPDPETDAWMLVKASDDISDLEFYLDSYPKGKYSVSARIKLKQLKRKQKGKTKKQKKNGVVKKRKKHHSAEWKNKDGSFWLYINGKSYGKESESSWWDDNLLVFIPSKKEYYLLEDYKHRADDTLRPAKKMHTPNNTFWRNKNGSFWVIIDGVSYGSGTKSVWIDNHLLAYVPKHKKYYLMEDYNKKADNTLRPTKIIKSPNRSLWLNKNGNFRVIVDGTSYSSGINNAWIDDHLLAYVPKHKKYYLMENYKKRSDNTLRPAKIIYTPNSTLWRNKNGSYWVYIDGKSYGTGTESEWKGDDLLVYVKNLKNHYLLEDYDKNNTNTLIPAKKY